MKVCKLIEMLQQQPPDARVFLPLPGADYVEACAVTLDPAHPTDVRGLLILTEVGEEFFWAASRS